MNGPAQRGSALTEALVSLALSGMILAAVLPAVVQARRAAAAAGQRSQMGDSGRLAGWRMREDLRLAGFGLAGLLPALSLAEDGHAIVARYVDEGFTGGHPLAATAVAGARVLQLTATSGLAAGDTCLLSDRLGGAQVLEVTSVDRSARTVRIAAALAREYRPEEGARVQRVAERRWWLDGAGLRMDSQPATEQISGLDIAVWPAPESDGAASWALMERPAASSDRAGDVVAVRLHLTPAPGGEVGVFSPAVRGLDLVMLVRARNAAAGAAGSALP